MVKDILTLYALTLTLRSMTGRLYTSTYSRLPVSSFILWKTFFSYFFLQIRVFLQTLTIRETALERRGPSLFFSTTSARSRTFRHLQTKVYTKGYTAQGYTISYPEVRKLVKTNKSELANAKWNFQKYLQLCQFLKDLQNFTNFQFFKKTGKCHFSLNPFNSQNNSAIKIYEVIKTRKQHIEKLIQLKNKESGHF